MFVHKRFLSRPLAHPSCSAMLMGNNLALGAQNMDSENLSYMVNVSVLPGFILDLIAITLINIRLRLLSQGLLCACC